MRKIADDELIQIRNRNVGSTGYTLDGNFHREFAPGEIKKVPYSELKQLSYAAGGDYILRNYLVIEDREVIEYLNMEVEPEYFYTENKVRELLFTGSVDAFADFLDFAPEGAIQLAKRIAIEEQIPDVRKRDLLSKRTGLNINNAIMVNEVMNEEEEEVKQEAPKRRVPIEDDKTETKEKPARRIVITEQK